jgi:hypothetical protein
MQILSDELIDSLGGTTAISRMVQAPVSTVHSWRRKGISASRLAHLKLAVQTAGLEADWDSGVVDVEPESAAA